jgi:sugar lactone lactonase YvrE
MRRPWFIVFALLIALAIPALAAAHQSHTTRIDLPANFRPEGIAIQGNSFFTGSLGDGSVFKGNLRTGMGDILVPPHAGRVAVGIAIDNRDRLFVAGGNTGMAFVYDARTGADIAAFTFATAGTFVNDVVVTKDAAWFTDSFQAVLHKVPIGPGGALGMPMTVPLTGDFTLQPGFNLNGIDATRNGKTLIAVQSNTGRLFAIDAATGEASGIDLGGESVPNGDGVLLDGGHRLFVVQNQQAVVTKIDLDSDLTEGEVESRTGNPDFSVPTGIDEKGDRLFIVNARFGVPNPNGEFWITGIEKP